MLLQRILSIAGGLTLFAAATYADRCANICSYLNLSSSFDSSDSGSCTASYPSSGYNTGSFSAVWQVNFDTIDMANGMGEYDQSASVSAGGACAMYYVGHSPQSVY